MRAKFIFRVRIIAFAIFLIALVLIGRLYFVQVVHGDEYRLKAESQYVSQSTNRIDRGSIFFSPQIGVPISAATIESGYTIAINPSTLANPQKAYDTLKKFFPDLDVDDFLRRAGKEGDVYEEIKRRVPESVGQNILSQDVIGIEVLRERWRFYPGDSLAAHAVGFVGFAEDGTTVTGRYGLERFYNDALSQSDGGLYVNFFADLFTNIRSQLFESEVVPGADLVTSIEPSVQQYLESILVSYQESWRPKTSGAIVMDPKSGSIIAIAALPTFDLNTFNQSDIESFSNPLIESVYEFGSTMKPLTMAAAIDAGAVYPDTLYDDVGYAVFDGARIENFDGKARGRVSMQEVLSQSLNTGIAFVVNRMGTKTLRDYFERYGITEETGIDLPNEASPLVDNLTSPRQIEYVTAGFGQGIAITPVAMTRALATLANNGAVPSPHVGVELDYGGGIKKEIGWSPPRQAISPESAETVSRMLVEVVDTALKGGTVKIPEYTIAAKTGTAQIARVDARGYYTDRYLHSFFGYFPAYDPKFLVFLFAVEPKGARYASETWTDPFMETVKFLITYYDIPPDRAAAVE